jgi:hypothetical protein
MTTPDVENTQGHIWVSSEMTGDGEYAVTVTFSPDQVVSLPTDKALDYARAVIELAQRAEYDAAILAQLTDKGGLPVRTAAEYIADSIRPFREPISTGTQLSLLPGVSSGTMRPFLGIELDGNLIGEWTVADALDHGYAVLDTISVTGLDNGYYRSLVERLGVDESRARAIVTSIADFRPPR